MWYISSKAGLRFEKFTSQLENYLSAGQSHHTILELDPRTKYQTVEGFGGGMTDAAGINWQKLANPELKQNLIDSYFSEKGLQYNMMRLPIGGSDFSTHAYAYNEYPENDTQLTNYSLSYEDYNYKIPFIKAASTVSVTPLHIVATTWSPPTWMKDNHQYSGTSRLKEYFQTYADYHTKFIDKYAEEDIPIWAVTTTNEPLDSVMSLARFNTLGWSCRTMGKWINENFGPTMRKSHPDIKILGVDDQRFTIPIWFNLLLMEYPEALQYIDGIAVHYYGDISTPPGILKRLSETYEDKFVLSTEACTGAFPWDNPKVDLGSWDRAVIYIVDILENLNSNVVGWIDWNMCLDSQGGPNWVQNYVDSPVIVFPESGQFVKQPMFYAMGHFSKFIPRGSVRIKVNVVTSPTIDNAAFLTPHNTIVVILHNDKNLIRIAKIKLGDKQASLLVEPNSITTVELPGNCAD
ncbi:LOW QUALITY PROTEIN: lysosomal acid glucosylceramidase-like [Aphomia sociella]